MLMMYIKNIQNRANIEHKSTTLYMVLFQSSFVILFHKWQFITVLSIQGPLHSNKLLQQILKEALQNHEF